MAENKTAQEKWQAMYVSTVLQAALDSHIAHCERLASLDPDPDNNFFAVAALSARAIHDDLRGEAKCLRDPFCRMEDLLPLPVDNCLMIS